LAIDIACLHCASSHMLERVMGQPLGRHAIAAANAAAKLERAFHSAVRTLDRLAWQHTGDPSREVGNSIRRTGDSGSGEPAMTKPSHAPPLTESQMNVVFRQGATDEEIETTLRDLLFWSYILRDPFGKVCAAGRGTRADCIR
jgi:hypothetical protein